MAKQVVSTTRVIDDFDGEEIDDGLAETFDFSFDGSDYTIDLRPKNADKLRGDLEKWVAAASKLTGKRGKPRATGTRAPSGSGRSSAELAAIREWAAKNGHEVSSRGRIAGPIQQAYDEAHAS